MLWIRIPEGDDGTLGNVISFTGGGCQLRHLDRAELVATAVAPHQTAFWSEPSRFTWEETISQDQVKKNIKETNYFYPENDSDVQK